MKRLTTQRLMKRITKAACAACVGAATVCAAPSANAQSAASATLEASAAGGLRATLDQKVTFSDTKPAGVTREPMYAYKPQYGTIALGGAKNNQIIVVLDTDGMTARPHLYVDANGNGDLTDDAPIMLGLVPSSTTGKAGTPDDTRLLAVVPVIARYDITGRGGTVPSALTFVVHRGELTYNRSYGRTGTLKLNGRVYRVALVDQGVNGKFSEFSHDEGEAARVTLLIDRNNDGRFDPLTEAYDAARPFRLAGSAYEITAIDPRGLSFAVRKSSKDSRTITAADLKPGSDALDFAAQTLDGKTVVFPDDYRNRLVLLYFWAAGNPTSTQEIPGVVALYNQYHVNGFDVLGISLDAPNQREAIGQFLTQSGIVWSQVYDGLSLKSEAAQLYDVRALPYGVLVDGRTGKIVAMGDELRGQGLARSIVSALRRRR